MAGKTVLITGCSTGIGRLAAFTFQREGWNVMATMRSPERETKLTKLDSVVVARLDVTDPECITAAVDGAIKQFGEIDVLVNNAGRGGRALLEQTSDEKIRSMFETNVFGLMQSRALFFLTCAVEGEAVSSTSRRWRGFWASPRRATTARRSTRPRGLGKRSPGSASRSEFS